MARFLYWLVYNFDLGPLGPAALDLAVKIWLYRHRRCAADNGSYPAFRFWAPDHNLSFEGYACLSGALAYRLRRGLA